MAARLNAPRRSRKPTPSPSATPRDAGPGDNINAAAQEEWERIQLIKFVGQLDAADIEVEKAAGPYKAALAARSAIKKLAQGAGFTAAELKERREEMAATAGENARKAARETKHRKWLGITSAEQQKMHLEEGTPLEARDELDWQGEGYKRGLRGRGPELPEGMDHRFTQPFLKGHEIGWNEYLAAIAQNVPKPKNMTAQEVAEKAAAEFAKDNPEVDLDAAAKKLAKDPKFMARGAPEPDDGAIDPKDFPPQGSADDPTINYGAGDCEGCGHSPGFRHERDCPELSAYAKMVGAHYDRSAGPDDGFEATAEELAAQKPRQAVQAVREAEEEAAAGADVV